MRRAPTLVVAALSSTLALLPPSVLAKPVVVASTVLYPVVGGTESAVRESLDKSPLSPDGKRRVGYTQADIRWQYEARERKGKCRVVSVTVTLTAKTTLPQWTPPPGASGALRRSWTAFLDALTAHEQGHSDIAFEAAQRIEDALWRAPMPRTCTGYSARLDAMANTMFDDAVRRQEAYDAETDYGRVQGVKFP